MGNVGQRVQTSTYKMNNFWGSNIQHGEDNWQYCIVHLKATMRVDLKYFHHWNKTLVIVWGDEYVNQPYCGNHFAVYMCIKSSHYVT